MSFTIHWKETSRKPSHLAGRKDPRFGIPYPSWHDNTTSERFCMWRMEEGKPNLSKPEIPGSIDVKVNILILRATGAELEYIRGAFSGLPMSNNSREVTWSGYTAEFIFLNLPEGRGF